MRAVDIWLQQGDEFLLQSLSSCPEVKHFHAYCASSDAILIYIKLILYKQVHVIILLFEEDLKLYGTKKFVLYSFLERILKGSESKPIFFLKI